MLLAAVFVLTGFFSLVITNKAAAVLMFPIAISAALERGYEVEPFIVGVMAAAACAFMTPLAVPTNLMVAGPGGYRFTDFARMGLPLTILAAIVTLLAVPIVYPFSG
jgi:di/tricarboxylate transporter